MGAAFRHFPVRPQSSSKIWSGSTTPQTFQPVVVSQFPVMQQGAPVQQQLMQNYYQQQQQQMKAQQATMQQKTAAAAAQQKQQPLAPTQPQAQPSTAPPVQPQEQGVRPWGKGCEALGPGLQMLLCQLLCAGGTSVSFSDPQSPDHRCQGRFWLDFRKISSPKGLSSPGTDVQDSDGVPIPGGFNRYLDVALGDMP